MSFYRHHQGSTFLGYLLSMVIMTSIILTAQNAFYYLGFPPYVALLILWLSLIGSMVNIPLTIVESETVEYARIPIRFFGITYVLPVKTEPKRALVAINFGGAVLPTIISIALLISKPIAILYAVPGIIIASVVINRFAQIIPGIGIAVPFLIPPVVSALLALILTFNDLSLAPLVAYTIGVFGSLIGADLMNLKKTPEMGAPIVSIGGAGTFDGVFLSGAFAVALIAMI